MPQQLPIPFDGTESIDFLRAENLTLKIENNKLEQDNVELRHNLHLALTKAGSWGGMKQRVTLTKPQSVVAERSWVTDVTTVAKAASHIDSTAFIASLEQHIAELRTQMDNVVGENERLRHSNAAQAVAIDDARREVGRLNQLRGDKGTAAAYFQSQISFLHSEVERLEDVARLAQAEAVAKIRAATEEHERHLKERDAELASVRDELVRVRAAAGLRGRGKLDGEDLLSRCRMMEVQLAGALAEKNALHVENGDLHAKVRKLEAAAKEKRQLLQEIQRTAASETQTSGEHAQRLSLLLSAALDEKTKLTVELDEALSKLNAARNSSWTQTDPAPSSSTAAQCDPPVDTHDAGAQVDSIVHFADSATQSVQSLRHALQAKCTEADETRAQLDTLAALHKDTLQFLEVSKQRLRDEMQRRAELEADVEGLTLQIRSMQQQVSQQCVMDREKDVIVQQSQQSEREASIKLLKAEEAQRDLEKQLATQRKDLQFLVANQNVHNHQLHEVNRQNALLSEEIQKLRIALEHDRYMIQAKDGELRDIASSYQMLAKEADVLGSSREVLEKENEGLRQAIRSLEERNVLCQEQIGHLHSREQQLSLDLQSYDHEVSLLHRKLQQAQVHEAELETQAQTFQHTIRALELAADEQRRNLAELSKQVVIRDNESMLLRTRCDSLEKELSALAAAQRSESKRVRDLEEANAQLVVRSILGSQQPGAGSSSNAAPPGTPPPSSFPAAPGSGGVSSSPSIAHRELDAEKAKNTVLQSRLASVERQLSDVVAANSRLERLATEQAETLAKLSQ